jgi:hypothetical protein
MAEQQQKEILKFMPFSSCINPSFWFELSRLKLDDYKLNDDYRNIFGLYNNCKLPLGVEIFVY